LNDISCDKKEKIEKINSQILDNFKLVSIYLHTVQKIYVNTYSKSQLYMITLHVMTQIYTKNYWVDHDEFISQVLIK
jgi:hypothetical protein